MLAKRIIPCLDIKDGRVVKGTKFVDIHDAGDPVELAAFYNREGADELVFLDISASYEGRGTVVDIVRKVAEQVFIPLTVGGGIRTVDDIREVLKVGADKISVNTQAVKNPQLISDGARIFGRQCIVVAIDARRVPGSDPVRWEVMINGGKTATGIDAVEWAEKVEALGAGELLVTSMDADGTKDGYDNELNRSIAERVGIPVIASGGAGKLEHLKDALTIGKADAVLAASIFHYGKYTIREVKEYLSREGIPVRL